MALNAVVRSLMLAAVSAILSFAQSAEISGIVTDASGAPMASAQVTVTNVEKQTNRQVTTNESGLYTVTNLVPGLHQVTVQVAGFQPTTRSGFRLDVNQSLKLDFAMKVGDVQQTVEVTGEAPVIETTTG